METVHEEFLGATMVFIDRANLDKKPFFAWFNSTRMHIWTRLKPGVAGQDRPRHLSGRHGGTRRRCSASPTILSSSTRPTTAPGAPRRSARQEEYQLGTAIACRRWCAVAPHTEINGIFSAEDWVQTRILRRRDN